MQSIKTMADADKTTIGILLFSIPFLIILQIIIARISQSQEQNPNKYEPGRNNKLQHSIHRGIQHATTGLLFTFLSYYISRTLGSILLLSSSLILYIIHILRFKFPTVQRYYLKCFGALLRKHELNALPGAFYFLLGTGLTFLYTPDINTARIALVCLSISDPSAGIIGRLFGGTTFLNGRKSLIGCISYFCISFCVCYYMLIGVSAYGVMIISTVSTLVEALAMPIFRLDDNLCIPIVTSLVITMIS